MSQVAALRALDATIMAHMTAAGFSDAAVYQPPTIEGPTPCRVYVDRGAQFYGPDGAQVAGYRTAVTLMRTDVAAPTRGGTVTLVATGEKFTLSEIEGQDESLSRWVALT